ncbi:MAG: sugar transferase [Actinomycetota bacterium]|jgi:lipopolysaccharide/colanic/teichoic acid biosynthesis glycosyltransferase
MDPLIGTLNAPIALEERSSIVAVSAPPVASTGRAGSAGNYARYVKPAIDKLLAASALLALTPVGAAVAIIVRIDLGPGVLFRQRRVGLGGKEFTVLKFRTMLHEAPAGARSGPCLEHGHKCPNDPRHTRMGKLLRKLSLDEIPQLVNVLRGEMSLVGPRPELPEIVARYEPWQHERHDVKPGLTGLWQVTERGNGKLMWQSTTPDVVYARTVSLRTDVSILVRTVPALLGKNRGH